VSRSTSSRRCAKLFCVVLLLSCNSSPTREQAAPSAQAPPIRPDAMGGGIDAGAASDARVIGHGSGAGSSGGYNGRFRQERHPVQIRFGKNVVEGELSKEVIRRFLRQKLVLLRACYESQLATSPELAGTVVVDFEIDETGRVSVARAKGLHDKVDACFQEEISRIQFAKPRSGAVKAHYEFILSHTS
jgi:hypothetical protein